MERLVVVLCLLAVLRLNMSKSESMFGQVTIENSDGNWIFLYPKGVYLNITYGFCPNKKPDKIRLRIEHSTAYVESWNIFGAKVVKKFRWGFTAMVYRTADYSYGPGPKSIVLRHKVIFGSAPKSDSRLFQVGRENYCVCNEPNSTSCRKRAPVCKNVCKNGGKALYAKNGHQCDCKCRKQFKGLYCDYYKLKSNSTISYQSNSTRYFVPYNLPIESRGLWVSGMVKQNTRRLKKFRVYNFHRNDYTNDGFYVYIQPRRWKNHTRATVVWKMEIVAEYNRKLLASLNGEVRPTAQPLTKHEYTPNPPQVAVSGIDEVNYDFIYCIDKVYEHIVYDRCYPSNATKVEVSIVDAPVYRPPFVASVLNISVWGFTVQIKKQNGTLSNWPNNQFSLSWKAWFDQSTINDGVCQEGGHCHNTIKGQRCSYRRKAELK